VLGYKSELATTPNNSERESMETKADSVMRLVGLPLLPTCPLRSRFLYTFRWLIIHVAFCAVFEPSEVHSHHSVRNAPQSYSVPATCRHRFRGSQKSRRNSPPSHLCRFR